jgi:hypothetical protein
MKPPTLHPERRHCLGCRHLQPGRRWSAWSWFPGEGHPPDPPCKRPMLRIVGKPRARVATHRARARG